jgi:hypothetical protein
MMKFSSRDCSAEAKYSCICTIGDGEPLSSVRVSAIAKTIKLLAKNKQENYKGVNVFQDPFGRKNYEWSFVDCGRQGCTTIPWPNSLQITPTL